MGIPNFQTKEESDTFLVKTYEEIIKKVEQASSYQEKEKILKEFEISKLNAENTLFKNEKIKDNENYKKIKKTIYEFLEWIEKERKVNVFNIIYKDNFYIKNEGFKFPVIANLLSLIPQAELGVKIYLILNTFRTVYELNLKNLVIILDNLLKESGRPTKKFYDFRDIDKEFSDYPNIQEIKKYFANDIRNPIAHEDWFLENNLIKMKDKGIEKNFSVEEIFLQIHDLFFFKVAIKSYVLEGCEKIIKEKDLIPHQINSLIDIFKKKMKEIKNKGFFNYS